MDLALEIKLFPELSLYKMSWSSRNTSRIIVYSHLVLRVNEENKTNGWYQRIVTADLSVSFSKFSSPLVILITFYVNPSYHEHTYALTCSYIYITVVEQRMLLERSFWQGDLGACLDQQLLVSECWLRRHHLFIHCSFYSFIDTVSSMLGYYRQFLQSLLIISLSSHVLPLFCLKFF